MSDMDAAPRRSRVRRWISENLPAGGTARVLVFSSLVNSIGTGLFLAGGVIYFVEFVGFSAFQVGLGLSIAGIVGFATTVPIGRLAVRYGEKRVLIAIMLYRAVGYIAYLFVTRYWQYLLVACLLYIAERGAPAVNQTMVARLIPRDRRSHTMGAVRSVRNAGLTFGFLLAGIALATKSRFAYDLLFAGNALSFVVASGLLSRLPAMPVAGKAGKPDRQRFPHRDKRFAAFTALNFVLLFHDSLLLIALPAWVVSDTSAPAGTVTILLTINTLIAVFGQVPTTKLTRTYPLARRMQPLSGVLLAGACLVYAFSGSVHNSYLSMSVLVLGTLLLTAAELLQSAASWQISFDLSPPDNPGHHIAFFNLSASAEEIVAPVVSTALLTALAGWGWVILAAIVITASLLTPLVLTATLAVPEPA
jgi:MFS family permease